MRYLLLPLLSGCLFIGDGAWSDRVDVDGDGVAWPDDCDDRDPEVGATRWFTDADGDGYGVGLGTARCDPVPDRVSRGGDCDDADPEVNPGAPELCANTVDDDCDGEVDEADGLPIDWFVDADGDGWGDPSDAVASCDPVVDRVREGGDCDDGDAAVSPGADERCNNIDDDCDDAVDEADAVDAPSWYPDIDEDGFGDPDAATPACALPEGYTDDASDCDDGDPAVHPGADEVCGNGVDDDCDADPADCSLVGDLPLADAHEIGGETRDDRAGTAVLLADLDGDDRTDVVVGAPVAGGTSAGAVYVLHGPVIATSVAAGARFDGVAAADQAGAALASGDVDGDGLSDLVIGAPYAEEGGFNAGTAYVVLGPASTGLGLGAAHARLVGEAAGHLAGTAVALSDVDGDGRAEVFVGAPQHSVGGPGSGAAYRVHSVAGTIDLGSAALRIGGDTGWRAGSALAGGADFDGDGLEDVAIGAPGATDGGAGSGAVFVLLGGTGRLDLGDDADARLGGENTSHAAGSALAAGDQDGDGYGDLVVGAPGHTGGGSSAGGAYLVRGPIDADRPLADADLRVIGEAAGHFAGSAVALGDVDDDGLLDLVVGANGTTDAGSRTGSVYLVLRPASGTLDLSDADARLYGEAADDRAGWAVSAGGDTNGDGVGDLLIGGPGVGRVAPAAGAAWLVLGTGI